MSVSPLGEVTLLLRQMAAGHDVAQDRLIDLVYAELHRMADRQLRGLRGQTLQPTALVHEAWMKIAAAGADFASREHFLSVAAKAMRSVLVDYVRKKRTDKRGGRSQRTPLDETIAFLEAGEIDLLDLDAALQELHRDDPNLVRWVEMRFFSGMTHAEIAAVENCSESTVDRGWRTARARLRSRLASGEEA